MRMPGGDHDIAVHRDLGRKAAMDAVVAQQMGIGLDRSQIIDRNDLDIAPARFHDRPQHQPPDTAKAVYGNTQSHGLAPERLSGGLGSRFRGDIEMPVDILDGTAGAETVHADEFSV